MPYIFPLNAYRQAPTAFSIVYKKNKTKQIVIIGELNDKNAVVKQGLEEGTQIFLVPPDDAASFRLVGQNLVTGSKESF